MSSFRTKETQERYNKEKNDFPAEITCPLCGAEPIKKFNHWKIVENKFPYDRIADIHHMLVPLNHVNELEISNELIEEMKQIKKDILHHEYEVIFESTNKFKSVPGHHHLHLLVSKKSIW